MSLTPRACGLWAPRAEPFLEGMRGRVEKIVKRTERSRKGIEYEVLVRDAGYDEKERQVWACFVLFKGHEESPTPTALQAAREQDAVVSFIWREFGARK